MLLATRCPVCDAPGASPCRSCIGAMRPASPFPPPPGLDACFAALAYAGPAREVVARLKYRNARPAARWLAAAMVLALPADEEPSVITWVPTTTARRRERGFDQAELLARLVARSLRVPCRRLLTRRDGAPQTGTDAASRHHATLGLFARVGCRGTVLLVDDVVTTGATLRAAAYAVRDAGAPRVIALVAARTPPPGT